MRPIYIIDLYFLAYFRQKVFVRFFVCHTINLLKFCLFQPHYLNLPYFYFAFDPQSLFLLLFLSSIIPPLRLLFLWGNGLFYAGTFASLGAISFSSSSILTLTLPLFTLHFIYKPNLGLLLFFFPRSFVAFA